MRRYALKRMFLGILCVLGVSVIIFVATRASGDVTYLLLPFDATEQERDFLRAELGLDKPIPIQYVIFIKRAVRGDFGESTRYQQPAMGLILQRMPATLELIGAAFFITLIFGLPMGMASALRRGSLVDLSCRGFALLGQGVPPFWMGIIFILIVAVQLRLLPASGRGGIDQLILPAVTLSWYSVAAIVRLTRSAMLDVLDSEYVKMARVKGNPEWLVIGKHALKNAAIPIITMAGLQVPRLIGSAVIVEIVFGWPGVGKLMLEAVNARDYPVVQAGVFLTSAIVILVNLAVDLAYGLLDPRIRYK
jgi:peptide/nickel transport system permease protein